MFGRLFAKKRGPRVIVFPPARFDHRLGREIERRWFYRQRDGSYKSKNGCYLNPMNVEAIITGVDWFGKPVDRHLFT